MTTLLRDVRDLAWALFVTDPRVLAILDRVGLAAGEERARGLRLAKTHERPLYRECLRRALEATRTMREGPWEEAPADDGFTQLAVITHYTPLFVQRIDPKDAKGDPVLEPEPIILTLREPPALPPIFLRLQDTVRSVLPQPCCAPYLGEIDGMRGLRCVRPKGHAGTHRVGPVASNGGGYLWPNDSECGDPYRGEDGPLRGLCCTLEKDHLGPHHEEGSDGYWATVPPPPRRPSPPVGYDRRYDDWRRGPR